MRCHSIIGHYFVVGYVNYVCGQLKAVAKKFYRKDVDIEVLSHDVIGSRVHVVSTRSNNTMNWSCLAQKRIVIPK